MGQNKENTNSWVKGAGVLVLVVIGIIASGGCFNWAASKPGEGAFWFFGAVNFISNSDLSFFPIINGWF